MQKKSLGMELVGTANMIKRKTFESVRSDIEDGPTKNQHWFMVYIWHSSDQEVYQKDLENNFRLRRSTVTEILNNMEKKDLIIREVSKSDKRVNKIRLTQRAIDLCVDEDKKIKEINALLERGITDKEREVFFAVLEKMQRNMQEGGN